MRILEPKRVQPGNLPDLTSVFGLIEKERLVVQIYFGADGVLLVIN